MPMQHRQRRDHFAAASSSSLASRGIADGTQIVLKPGFSSGQLAYSAPITVAGQEFNVQVDTGSSDLWLASTGCRTSACRPKGGASVKLFDAGTATARTNQDFSITYLAGSASGSVVQAPLSIGGYQIPEQAFASTSNVQSEQLGSIGASGVLGLALPANSIIQESINGPGNGNANNSITDSTRTGSILPGVWSGTSSGKKFFSVGLQRLPSDGGNGNSTLTFGGYDPAYLSDPTKIMWVGSSLESDRLVRKWSTFVSLFYASINGTDLPISIPGTNGQPSYASVIIDTAAAYNYGVPRVLNALYGAYNIGPAGDDSQAYYPDCKLEMQISLVINGEVMTIHPLDMNLRQRDTTSTTQSGCVGSFQPLLGDNPPADLVLGAPFLRSVYTAYSCDSVLINPAPGQNDNCANPQIGFAPLYNSSLARANARQQFNQVRVLGQSLGSDSGIESGAGGDTAPSSGGLSGGAKIAIGVVGGLLGIIAVMGILLLLLKRKRARSAAANGGALSAEKEGLNGDDAGALQLSAKERAKARELALLNGYLPEEALPEDPDADGYTQPAHPTGESWDVTSTGYYEALAIKNEWKRKHAAEANQSSAAAEQTSAFSRMTGGTSADRNNVHSEEHELSEHGSAAPLHPRAF